MADYRELYSDGADVDIDASRLTADVTAYRLDRLIMFDRRLTGVGHVRDAQRVAGTGFSHFTLHLMLGGAMTGSAPSGFDMLRPGEIVLQDLRHPTRTSVADGWLVTVSVARDLIEAAAGTSNGLHGRVIRPDKGWLLADYLRSLASNAGSLDHDALPTLSRTFVELLSVAIGPQTAGGAAAHRREEFNRREAVQRVIERRLEDPSLNAAEIVNASGVSRATLYRLFQPHGGVDTFLTGRRLAAVRTILERPDDTSTIASLAERFAFRSEKDLSVAFRDRFGISMSAYRRMVDDPAQAVSMMKRRWASWMVEVR
ncbi:MAG: helix-turn-helix domain-containing protein [Pseudomonadota bacterium]|nr:helix-turn-helix domain-containing protein [Pseudomonadota bacterium]